jgi:iron complex outermembrane receptor protein
LSEISYKTYGTGGVGSISYRGLPANQTPFIWNGINLASPLLGQADLNQFLLSQSWQTSLLKGGSAGSGAIILQPAAEEVHSAPLFSDTLKKEVVGQARLGVGTYGQHTEELHVGAKLNSLSFQFRFLGQKAKNNFRIYRSAHADSTLPTSQQNAATAYRQSEIQLGYNPKKGIYTANLALLTNHADRQLPPPISKYFSKEQLISQTLALSLRQKVLITRLLAYHSTVGFVQDTSLYVFENGRDLSPFGTRSIQLGGIVVPELSTGLAGLVFRHNHQWAQAIKGDYPKTWWQQHTLSAEYVWKKDAFQLSPRLGLVGFQQKLYSLAGITALYQYAIGQDLQVEMQFRTQSLFRGPTLNDLYYPSVGNPELPVERGRSYEAHFSVTKAQARLGWEVDISPFIYQYQTFISWLPQGNLWYPQPRPNGRSSGVTVLLGNTYHATASSSFTLRQQYTLANGGYGGGIFTFSPRPESFIYVPSHRYILSLGYKHRRLHIDYQLNATSKRPIVTQGTATLDGFALQSLGASYHVGSGLGGQLQLGLQVSVGAPAGYSYLANYAAPRYWGQLTASIKMGYGK